MNTAPPPVLVFVGGGPRTVSLLERISANAAELLPAAGLTIHVVDPYPAGGGRIWRRDQSPLLWMNSVAGDVTIFTDESVVCAGPVVPGPPLDKWVAGPGRQVLIDAGLGRQAEAFTPADFSSREIQSLYLSWVFDQVVRSLPVPVQVITHQQRAVSVADIPGPAGRQWVRLQDDTVLLADIVVLAQGYLDRRRSDQETALAAVAQSNGLVYVPPGFTADVDLGVLRPGSTVLVRGFGLAFVDLMVLLFQGRGGRFQPVEGGELEYLSSGAEPLLYVGSRRGVPYHAKLGYSLGQAAPAAPVYFTSAAIAALAGPAGTAEFSSMLWPLIIKELTAAHYRRLFEFHPQRTVGSWEEFSAGLDRLDASGSEFAGMVRRAVPDLADRFDLQRIDRPLAGRHFADQADLGRALVHYVNADLSRRRDPEHSPDHAVFNALLTVYGVLAAAVVGGLVSPADRVRYLEGEFHGLFSFLASGPPPRRLAELVALHRAGLVQFAGPDLQVAFENGRFVGTSPAVGGRIEADALVDARLPRPDVRSASDPIISGLLAAGELAAEDLVTVDGTDLGAGQLLADADCRAIRADRSVHPARFLLGPSVSGSAGSAGFARPGFNGAGLRQNDHVARELLQLAGRLTARNAGPAPSNSPPGSQHPPIGGRGSRPAARPAAATAPVNAMHPHLHPDRIENSHAR